MKEITDSTIGSNLAYPLPYILRILIAQNIAQNISSGTCTIDKLRISNNDLEEIENVTEHGEGSRDDQREEAVVVEFGV